MPGVGLELGMGLLLTAVAAAVVTGCHRLPPSKPLSELTEQEQVGRAVFASHCAECHSPNTQRALHGPGLQGLFRLQYLPSGAPANDERVTYTVRHGRGTMPAFGDRLDDEEMTSLLAYLHTL